MKKSYWGILSIIATSTFFLSVLLVRPFIGVMSEAHYTETITTTIYATLTTILLGLLTLAVTAYIFLAGFLKNQKENYKNEGIQLLLGEYTKELWCLTFFSLLSLLLCFFIDNVDIGFIQIDAIRLLAIWLSCVVSILLLVYTCFIIHHEKRLVRFARKSRRKLFPTVSNSKPYGKADDIFKWIGDLEMLIDQLIKNHRDNFHTSDDISVLRNITKREKADFCGKYYKLISYRNYLWIEQQSRDHIKISQSEYHIICDEVQFLEVLLRKQILQGERMQKQSFTAPFLSLSTDYLHLEYTVFTNAVFERNPNSPNPENPEGIDFRNAKLHGADFTLARLNYLNLKDADCTEAVFTKAVFNHIQVDAGSCFEGAVFQNTDFGSQEFHAEYGVISFENASFDDALLMGCTFEWCNLRQATFSKAVMSSIELKSVCLSYADLSNAVLTDAKLVFCEKEYQNSRFLLDKYRMYNQTVANGLSTSSVFKNGRWIGPAYFINLEKCTLSKACISDYDFTGSRMSNANFTYARLERCILDRCYGQMATFQEARLEHCRFSFAMFNQVDLSHAYIINCDFSDCDLRDSLLVQTTVQGKKHQRVLFHKANFTHAQVRAGAFTLCDFTDALLEDVDLRNAVFERCIFTNTSFLQSDMRGVVFRNCHFANTDFRKLDLHSFEMITCTGYWKSGRK